MVLRTIQRASQEAGVTPNTLRIYERLGFLRPSRDSAGRRVYTDDDITEATRIAARVAPRVAPGCTPETGSETGRRLMKSQMWKRRPQSSH
jgi:hypothetical protein